MNENNKISLIEKISYGSGDFASSIFWSLFSMFLLFFYTDVFGISAAAAGTMFLVTRLWDAVNDPLMGMLGDRTKTKWGRYTIGSGIKILSEKNARKLKPDYFFVMPYGFIREFIKREKKWLKSGGKFLLPYPKFKIISK